MYNTQFAPLTITQPNVWADRFIINGQVCAVAISRTMTPCDGVVAINNYSTGTGHSAHPNIGSTGSVAGMVKQGYWLATDKTMRTNGYTYNLDRVVVSSALDLLALYIERREMEMDEVATGYEFSLIPLKQAEDWEKLATALNSYYATGIAFALITETTLQKQVENHLRQTGASYGTTGQPGKTVLFYDATRRDADLNMRAQSVREFYNLNA